MLVYGPTSPADEFKVSQAIVDWANRNGCGWWHYISGVWLLSSIEHFDIVELAEMVQKKLPKAHVFAQDMYTGQWAGRSTVEGNYWLTNQWGPRPPETTLR